MSYFCIHQRDLIISLFQYEVFCFFRFSLLQLTITQRDENRMKHRTREVQFKILEKNVTFFAPGMSKAVLWPKKKKEKKSLQNGQPCSCKKCYIKENTVWTFIWFMVSERPLRHESTREVAMLRYRENCRRATQVPRVPSNFQLHPKPDGRTLTLNQLFHTNVIVLLFYQV